jgi:hypothetical protein
MNTAPPASCPPDDGTSAPAAVAVAVKRPRARKLTKPIGPYRTTATMFERGKDREVEISRITPHAIFYRIRGFAAEYSLPHAVGCLRAIALAAGADIEPNGKRRR